MCSVATTQVIFIPISRNHSQITICIYATLMQTEYTGNVGEPNKLFYPLEVINIDKEIAKAYRSLWLFSSL